MFEKCTSLESLDLSKFDISATENMENMFADASNLGSIKTNSVYHHLNEYGTNSVVITIGTIREEKGKKIVDITATLDERIADGFYFAKSIQLAEYIAKNPELLLENFQTKVEIEDKIK